MEPTWAGVIFTMIVTVAAVAGFAKVVLMAAAEIAARNADDDYEGKYIF